jgi:hypothetical protein
MTEEEEELESAMTEEKWLMPTADVPAAAAIEIMMNFLLDASPSERKLRLFASAICQPLAPLLVDERSRAALSDLEPHADGQCDPVDFESHAALASDAFDAITASLGGDPAARSDPRFHAALAVKNATEERTLFAAQGYMIASIGGVSWGAIVAAGLSASSHKNGRADEAAAYEAESHRQIRLLREIFGNPFRPIAFDPAWRTTDVILLAKGIYDERAFDRMPILADAFQDAGCDSDDILNHLRDTNATHVRGCWALDLVLGKE